jgi:hypothetical protein
MTTNFEALINSHLDYWTNRSHAITDMFRSIRELSNYSIERDSTGCPTFLQAAKTHTDGSVYILIYDVRPEILKAHDNKPICIEYDIALKNPGNYSLQERYYRMMMWQKRNKVGEKYSPEAIHLLHTLPDIQSPRELQQEYQQYFKNMCIQCRAKEALDAMNEFDRAKEIDALIAPIVAHLKQLNNKDNTREERELFIDELYNAIDNSLERVPCDCILCRTERAQK